MTTFLIHETGDVTVVMREAAVKAGEYLVPNEAALRKVPTALLVKVRNVLEPEKPIKKFSSRKVAIDQVLARLNKLKTAPETIARERKAEVLQKPTGTRKRYKNSDIITIIHKGDNPRRQDSHGARSWAVIADGMTVGAFCSAGGRLVDLRMDAKCGRVLIGPAAD